MKTRIIVCYVTAITEIGIEFGDVRPLDEARKRRLKVNRVHLLDLIDPNHAFVTELASPKVGCITWSQRDHLINMTQPRERNEKLVDSLSRRSVADFEKFIRVLSKEQKHLVPLLATDGGEKNLQCLYQRPHNAVRRLDLTTAATRISYSYEKDRVFGLLHP